MNVDTMNIHKHIETKEKIKYEKNYQWQENYKSLIEI